MNWIKGRQNSGYYKLKLLVSKFFKFDIYILKYPKGSYIDTHKDPVEGYEHHRLNIILKRPKKGGTFFCGARHCTGQYPDYNRIIKFRPDILKHSLNRIEEGTRYVLSIGWLRRLRGV